MHRCLLSFFLSTYQSTYQSHSHHKKDKLKKKILSNWKLIRWKNKHLEKFYNFQRLTHCHNFNAALAIQSLPWRRGIDVHEALVNGWLIFLKENNTKIVYYSFIILPAVRILPINFVWQKNLKTNLKEIFCLKDKILTEC